MPTLHMRVLLLYSIGKQGWLEAGACPGSQVPTVCACAARRRDMAAACGGA